MDEIDEQLMEYCKNADSRDAWAVARIMLDMRRMDREDAERSAARAEKAAEQARKDRRFTMILCVVALIACLIVCVLASGVEVTMTTTTTTVEQDTGEGGRDAVYQSGENARYYAVDAEGGDG